MTSRFLISRRRIIARFSRPMTLRRQTAVGVFTDLAVSGVLSVYRPEQLVGGVQQGDANVAILDDEIQAAAWPGPPRAKDALLIDGRTWQVVGAMRVYDAAVVVGHMLWIRGGAV